MTFACALRSILRSDPDVIMVGEIRDTETAKMAIESALTGHFVLSTLHTNDAPGAITRLNEMGVEPFLTGSAVSAVLAQRLARKLCANCCEMYTPTSEELLAARISPDIAAPREGMVLYRKVGCPRCNRTGYKGRIGIFQLLIMNDELESLAAQNAPRDEIERAAARTGCGRSGTTGSPRPRQGSPPRRARARRRHLLAPDGAQAMSERQSRSWPSAKNGIPGWDASRTERTVGDSFETVQSRYSRLTSASSTKRRACSEVENAKGRVMAGAPGAPLTENTSVSTTTPSPVATASSTTTARPSYRTS